MIMHTLRQAAFLVVGCLILLNAKGLAQGGPPKRMVSLADIWALGTFRAASAGSIAFMQDDRFYTNLTQDNVLLRYAVADSAARPDTLMRPAQFVYDAKALEVDDYSFSQNNRWVMLHTKTTPIYRWSRSVTAFAYDLQNQRMLPIAPGRQIRVPTFSPDGNAVAYVFQNNIYIKDLNSGATTQVTTDGADTQIINGVPDWVYEEEFSIWKALWWSADSKHLSFLRFDEREVPEFQFELFQGLYPSQFRYKYPKAGEANSEVRLNIYTMANQQTRAVQLNSTANYYIPRVQWNARNGQLGVMLMNRHQSRMEYWMVDPNTLAATVLVKDSSDTFVDEPKDNTVYFLRGSDQFILQSDRNGFVHLYLYNLDGTLVRPLTQGNWDVTEFFGVDETNGLAYYQSSEGNPTERYVCSISLNGRKKAMLSETAGWHEATFSPNLRYCLHQVSDARTPPVTVLMDAPRRKPLRTLQANAALRERLRQFQLSQKVFIQIPNGLGEQLNAWMLRPANFDSTRQYPVLMYVYGGPGSQTVMNAWEGANAMWFQHLADQGYIVLSVDNRGTGGRGSSFRKSIYLQMGKLETQDQIAAAKWLQGQPWVAAGRIGIFGWSFGGYLSSLCLLKGADVFKAAIAVAPVTNWRFYDTIYTERYLRTPSENASGYDDNSPLTHANKLKGNYLLVHGMADDNVHFQNAAEMVNALVGANKQFDVFFYPNRNHGIYGGNTRLHLYTRMTNYLLEKL